jgi:diguanylate cyclase (GGDEF)-like protein
MAEDGHSDKLLAIIDAQNQLAATRLDLDAAMALIVEQAHALTSADSAALELVARGTARSAVAGDPSAVAGEDGATLSVVVRRGSEPVGTLAVRSASARAFDSDDEQTLGLLAAMVGPQLGVAEATAEAAEDGLHDSLTGLGNSRAYRERLTAECSRARRHGDALTLCLLELDAFEELKERHGQPAGDEVLRQVGSILGRLRTEDAAFRIGPHEFAVLLPSTSAEQATVALERLSAHIAARVFGAVSTSSGLADGPLDPRELHAAAEARLLAAEGERESVAARA